VSPNYDEKYVAHLFDQMGASYDIVNLISSFGFSEIWRAHCVRNLPIQPGAVVADLMAGSGECWNYLVRRIKPGGEIISVDFSSVMCKRQKCRLARLEGADVQILHENALSVSLSDHSVDFIVSAFGLKTFNAPQLDRLAAEMFRILRAGGSCSLLEISLPTSWFLRVPYQFYINSVIPLLGRAFLKDIECYRMLGVYTRAFGSCAKVVEHFQKAGFQVVLKKHFFGCASSIIARKMA
jgi:demethylmenaquinone methyltransferase/2-methoxy-6-polyprenyl-1,4-benzoquinol methylase